MNLFEDKKIITPPLGFEYQYKQKKQFPKIYNNIPVKESFGIILCRKNQLGLNEALIVKKRYTYSYAEFVHGHYSNKDMKKIFGLFQMMTPDELLDIWSLNFEQIWYRIWLSYDHTSHYNKKSKKFINTFIKDDEGVALRKLIEQVKVFGGLYYEFPKGKKLSFPNGTVEDDLQCAVRELEEETNIDSKFYRIIPDFRRVFSYQHMGVRYVNTFYLAVAKNKLITKNINYISNDITNGEVIQVEWMNIIKIRLIDSHTKMLEKLIKPAFNVMKKYYKELNSNNK